MQNLARGDGGGKVYYRQCESGKLQTFCRKCGPANGVYLRYRRTISTLTVNITTESEKQKIR